MMPNAMEQWLAGAIGLDAFSLGSQAVADAVKNRMTECGLTQESEYRERVKADGEERQALIEAITVPETWFFRDREPFVFMAHYVRAMWAPAHPADRLRVLSIPCSTGEEPYSIAIALQEAGVLPDRYQIDAVDISRTSLHKAQEAAYGRNSFRGAALDCCERYFKTEGAVCVVRPEIRNGIRFYQGNIMDADVIADKPLYDIIFCRNLLIYQHEEARRRIIAMLDRRLKVEGLLFVGHAEMMPLLTARYEPVRHSGVFACCKIKTKPCDTLLKPVAAPLGRGADAPIPTAQAHRDRGYRSNSPNRDQALSSAIRVQPGPAPIPRHASSRSTTSQFDRVRALADQGRLDEAAAACEGLLKENPQLAGAHFLMGLIREADGQIQLAEECLNRAIYLDADYFEALLHLALLKARRGDQAGAENLRGRAQRLREHQKVLS